jgi:tetratricopeptide (TPR) repeat protein
MLLAGAGLLGTASGCGWVRPWLAHRSAECHHLCDESREARTQGRLAEADSYLNAALRRRPQDHETRLHLAEELWSSGRQLAAAEVLEKLIQEAPDDAQVALRLAEMEVEIGRTQAARNAIELAFRIDPEHTGVLRLKAQLELRQGDADAAQATYHRLVQAAPDDLGAVLSLAELQLRRGHPDRAAPQLRSVVEHPFVTIDQRAAAHRLLGDSYSASGRWGDAADCLWCALQQCAEPSAEDWFRLATLQARCGQSQAALSSATQSLRQQPDHAGALQLVQHLQIGPQPAEIVPADFHSEAAAPMASERL